MIRGKLLSAKRENTIAEKMRSSFLKYFDEEEEEQQETPNIMNLLNVFMGNGQESASNPFAEIMQKMMTPNEDGANPFSEIMQKMMTPDSSQ